MTAENLPLVGECYEGATPVVRVDFVGENLEPLIPDSVTWRVIDRATETVVVADTTLTVTTTFANLDLPAAATAAVTADADTELRLLRVTFIHTGGRVGVYQALFRVVHV